MRRRRRSSAVTPGLYPSHTYKALTSPHREARRVVEEAVDTFEGLFEVDEEDASPDGLRAGRYIGTISGASGEGSALP